MEDFHGFGWNMLVKASWPNFLLAIDVEGAALDDCINALSNRHVHCPWEMDVGYPSSRTVTSENEVFPSIAGSKD